MAYSVRGFRTWGRRCWVCSKPPYSQSRIAGDIECGSLQVALQGGLNGPVGTFLITQKHADCRYRCAFRRGYGGPGIDEVLWEACVPAFLNVKTRTLAPMALVPHVALRFVTKGFTRTISLRMQKKEQKFCCRQHKR